MLNYYNNLTKTLKIPSYFNKTLKNIPNDTEIIIFDAKNKCSKFNQKIKENVLPDSLHTLSFDMKFNQEIKENVLPKSLHTLILGWIFNQEIKENVLPDSLYNITFGGYFNQEIKKNVLPKLIKKICLHSHFNLINNLPMTLEKIVIKDKKYLKFITKIPFGCKIVIKDF